MGIRTTVAALGGGATVLAVALGGIGPVDEPPGGSSVPASSVVPAPPGDSGGALRVKPAGGGGGCILGLNCGPINPPRPPPARRAPSLPHGPHQGAPMPQHP
ncbi:hypothetical protein AWC29_07665 [Mycobacterium triplex]|uniref:Uncharacterized protein n=1 Tax=Mycobacterium triplex TaxID=47839 RepID=A0ABX3WAU0_9MYCO|nr:hypothetical protein [Mycobacterium triplex]ORX07170.1 hypothetical protein AWC29_07665 [Mycobacterium triplex]